jgi:ribosome-binding factor A
MLSLSRILGVSKRRVIHRMNEKLLTAELESIDEIVRDSSSSSTDFARADEEVFTRTVQKAKRMLGIVRKSSSVDPSKVRLFYVPGQNDEQVSSGEVFSTKPAQRSPLDQFNASDLTHEEIRRVQELKAKKRMLDRKMKYLKSAASIDPLKSLNKEFNKKERELRFRDDSEVGPEDPIPALNEMDPTSNSKARKILLKMDRDTAISRYRTELRKGKLERSAVAKLTTPDVGNVVTDPLKKHLKRRNVRVSLLIQQYLEELLTCNTSQILLDHLNGAAVSIDRISSPSTRGRHDVYIRVSSDHDKKWVEEKLNVLAPKLRSQIALRVNYGYTPEFKFIVVHDTDKFNKKRLMALAVEARTRVDNDLKNHFMKEMNWK